MLTEDEKKREGGGIHIWKRISDLCFMPDYHVLAFVWTRHKITVFKQML